MKILVIGAHPDDEVLGCGGVIQKHIAQGDSVDVCIVTKAADPEWDDAYRENKIKEQKDVDKFLGISNRYFFNYNSLELNTIQGGRFNWHFYKIIEQVKPDIIYTHYNQELNEEHNLVSNATLVGSRIPNKATVYMYETESSRYFTKSFTPNYYVELSEVQFFKKRISFLIYKSEVKLPPHPRSPEGITNLANYRGGEVGVDYAEAFIQIRRLWQ